MVFFVGYLMLVQYKVGIMVEYLQIWVKVGLFDVFYMGQVFFIGLDYEIIVWVFEVLILFNFVEFGFGC